MKTYYELSQDLCSLINKYDYEEVTPFEDPNAIGFSIVKPYPEGLNDSKKIMIKFAYLPDEGKNDIRLSVSGVAEKNIEGNKSYISRLGHNKYFDFLEKGDYSYSQESNKVLDKLTGEEFTLREFIDLYTIIHIETGNSSLLNFLKFKIEAFINYTFNCIDYIEGFLGIAVHPFIKKKDLKDILSFL